MIFILAALGVFISQIPDNHSETMWLTQADLNELAQKLQETPALTSEDVAGISTRQVQNILSTKNTTRLANNLFSWRLLFVVAPILLVGVALTYLVTKCYPPAVFPWGDAEEWYSSLINRRKTIWSLAIGALLIGIIANLFVYGIGGFLQSSV